MPSQSSDSLHRVRLTQGDLFCDCADFELRQEPCKHIHAARLTQERQKKVKAPKIDTDALPQKKTYAQNWKAYNLAQTTERHRFQVLLADLCAGVPEPEYPGVGRRPVALPDRIFASIYKVYAGLSSRRFGCDLIDAHTNGHLSRPLHPNKVNCFMADADMTEPLKQLVGLSAMPLSEIETNFAVDSSGFSVSKFIRWTDEKYGSERSGRDWVKVHICTGVKTNIVTAIEIKDRDAADGPLLPELVTSTALNFKLNDVVADKGYLSKSNVDLIDRLGGTAFIAPKCNTTGKSGGLFEAMVNFYRYKKPEFLERYHRRSNVESTFSAVKRKFGDSVRSKTPDAMVNECLCKFIAYNLTVVIMSQIELGIEAEFWKDDRRDVLKMRGRA
ncbi:MAG: transposase [Gemmataceae bacterium]